MTTLHGKSGCFINAREGEGFNWYKHAVNRRLLVFPRVLWRFELVEDTPLTWHEYHGTHAGFWRPDRNRITDGGSVPSIMRAFLPESQFPASYSMHDDAWSDHEGLGLGLYYSPTFDGPYRFHVLTRSESNGLLQHWVDAEGARAHEMLAISAGVGLGARAMNLCDRIKAVRK